ncbi:MAG: prolyl oligopeptidase family serine peptidase, partial [Actinobacteria bacterium]|nr:prolyl oligopeptidase family serine peptidase [Actinomycetota bacterium]
MAAGYNVLTSDPRGLGGSGGTVMFDSPDFEARDVAALVDFVAAQPEALLDVAGDPRVGMSGFSYGGGIQFVSAAVDRRIDAIVPDGAWHSLVTSFFKDGAVKAGWLALICGGGEAAASAGGAFFSDAGLQLGGTAPELKRACVEALAGGAISDRSRQWFADRGPGALVDRIRAPTLILQGTTDALLPPSEAIANYDRLRRNNVPVKMMWYCGGHGQCLTPAGDPRYVARAALAWFKRWLDRDVTVDTGPRFEWIADDGVWRSGPDFPLAPAGSVDAAGTGSLTISPADYANSGLLTFATPAVNAATVRFASAPPGSDVLGAPRLRLVYRGTAVPARTFVYAQVVDARAARVAGGQVTPIPVVLDGRTRVVERALEPLALRGRPRSDLRLQVTPGTTFYGPQRSTGAVRLLYALLDLEREDWPFPRLAGVLNAVLFRPLPYPEPDRLVTVNHLTDEGYFAVMSPPNFRDVRAQNTVLEEMSPFTREGFTLTGRGEPVRLDGAAVGEGYFDVLGVEPVLGRTVRPGENEPGTRVAVLAHGTWAGRFGSDP